MPKTKEREPGFEASLSSLEKIVAQLESGDLPLERALELFEEGVGLARRCQAQLEEAERRVDLLIREHGEIKAVPFDLSRAVPASETVRKTPASANSARIGAANSETEEADNDDFDESIPF